MGKQLDVYPDDQALLARMAAGDERALGELYDRHGRAVYGIAYAVTGDAADAEEAAADAFMQCWRNAASFDGSRGTVQAWLVTIARSRALDRGRTRDRRLRAFERAAAAQTDPGPLALATTTESPDLAGERRERSVLVRTELAALPDPQREVVELAFYGGLSHSQIAAKLNEPLGTVKTRMRSALQKLRDGLRPLLSEPS